MLHIRPFWLRPDRLTTSLLAFAIALSVATVNDRDQPAIAAVRPHVAVTVNIDASLYRKKLDGLTTACGPNCATLERELSDTLRAMFESRYKFVDWSIIGGVARDTVSVRLIQRNATSGPVTLVMSLTGRARQYMHAPEEIEFETWIFATLRDGADWAPARLRVAWSDALNRRLDSFSPRLVANVIGRLPLAGSVVFDAARSTADVQVSADSLRAAARPAPKFLVRLSMPSRTATGDIAPDTAELVLDECRRTTRGFYTCEPGVFTWRERSGSDSLFRQKARDTQLTTASVHLNEYTPLPPTLTAGGLASPRNPRP